MGRWPGGQSSGPSAGQEPQVQSFERGDRQQMRPLPVPPGPALHPGSPAPRRRCGELLAAGGRPGAGGGEASCPVGWLGGHGGWTEAWRGGIRGTSACGRGVCPELRMQQSHEFGATGSRPGSAEMCSETSSPSPPWASVSPPGYRRLSQLTQLRALQCARVWGEFSQKGPPPLQKEAG